jgi:hypothetical protein
VKRLRDTIAAFRDTLTPFLPQPAGVESRTSAGLENCMYQELCMVRSSQWWMSWKLKIIHTPLGGKVFANEFKE